MHRLVTLRHLTLVAVLLTLQYGLAFLFWPLKGWPDLLSLAILDYAFFWSWQRVSVYALGIGLLRDFAGGHLFGIETLTLALTGSLLSLGIQKLDRESASVRLGISFLFVILTGFLSAALGVWLETGKGFQGDLITHVFLSTIYTTALAPGFFWLTDLWFRRTPVLKQYELF